MEVANAFAMRFQYKSLIFVKTNVMLSIKGIYDGKQLKLAEKIKIRSPKKVIVTFLDAVEDELGSEELHQLAQKGGAFDFLNNKEEDIYTDKDLKVVYK
jgi:hypothetical protein